MNKSILDQVIYSQKMNALSQFDPEDLASRLFEVLNDREKDIIVKRYGLKGDPKVTLEEIGSAYKVTRERVRQVENASLKRIKEAMTEDALKELATLVQASLEEQGDIMSERRLIESLLPSDKSTESNAALIRFVLNQLLADKLSPRKEDDHVYKAWALPAASWEKYHKIVDKLTELLEKHGEPLTLEDLVERAKDHVNTTADSNVAADVIIVNYLDVTKKIEENKFKEWGLAHWSSITPKRMNDKIYLVMKKEGKPMHFVEIAKKINEAKFDSRVAYPATIHNELILDKKYVLVGRGIYALTEWGFKPGVVVDVIRDIINASAKPLNRDEIIERVLKHRMVKKSTVMLALMNKKVFKRNADGTYQVIAA